MTRTIGGGLAGGLLMGVAAMAASVTYQVHGHPEIPPDLVLALKFGSTSTVLSLLAVGLLVFGVRRTAGLALASVGLLVALISIAVPAFADTAPAPSGVTVPYGQWVVDYGLPLAGVLGTWVAGVVTWALAKWAPWASSVLTQQRVQMAAQALAEYAVNAVKNSTRDGKVTVSMGPAVVEKAVQRGVDVLPGRVLKAAIKGGGLAAIVFRVLDLEEGADETNVLDPAVKRLSMSSDPKVAKAA